MLVRPEQIILKRTCELCPEQYDAYYNDLLVGYIRLRYGHLSVECPFGHVVTEIEFPNEWKGCFEDDERDAFLATAREAIAATLNAYRAGGGNGGKGNDPT